MKFVVRNLLLGVLVFALAGVAAFAKDKVKRSSLIFTSDVVVNGTTVKAGKYNVKFNEETGDLELSKDGKVVVKTNASLESRTGKARSDSFTVRGDQLVSLTFSGDAHDVVLSKTNQTTGN